MLKWYLRIYIFIEYLKCVCKSNCIWIIRNDSKKKSEDRVPESRFSLWVGYCGASRHKWVVLVPWEHTLAVTQKETLKSEVRTITSDLSE